jgi:hypothetical protein
MHHIRHIRKRKYELIPTENYWERQMSQRNRNQIPVCKDCHINTIHKGKYGGTRLNKLVPQTMWGGRLIVLESHIHKGKEKDYTKSLEQKGWLLQSSN